MIRLVELMNGEIVGRASFPRMICVIIVLICAIVFITQSSNTNMLQRKAKMFQYFSYGYFEVYVVDLNRGSYEIVRSTHRSSSHSKKFVGNYSELIESTMAMWVKPRYQELFYQLCDMEQIKEQFRAGAPKIEFIYESYDEKWKCLKCFPVINYGLGNEKMIFTIKDYDEEMKIRIRGALSTEAMNNIYVMVAFRDVEADRYERVHCAEEIFDFPAKGNYSELTQRLVELIHPDDRESYLTEFSDERFEKNKRAEGEYRLLGKDGQYHYYREYLTQVTILSVSRMVIIVKNIDEPKMHEIWKAQQLQKEFNAKAKELEMTKLLAKKSEDLEKALLQAENANRAKSKFLSNMSHDLRTPMSAILGMTYLARKHVNETEELEKCLEAILSSSQNMLMLINNALDMNKIEKGVIELYEKPTDLEKIIKDVETIIRSQCVDNGQNLLIDCSLIQHRYLYIDELRVRQILINLLSNAVKYTQDDGQIGMKVTELSKDGEYCTISFKITDNGIGMSADFIKRIFEPFEREKTDLSRKVEGTGLGMTIVENLVSIMKGHIDIDSTVNVGTSITVLLPFKVCTQKDSDREQEQSTLQQTFPEKRILIVEDKHINMKIIRGFLEDSQLVIDEARNGKEAVDAIKESKEGTYDLIFMDINMPVMKGDEAAIAIRKMERQDCKTIPIIAMTANALASDVQNSYRCGMNGHISKPIEPKEVYRCLNEWLS